MSEFVLLPHLAAELGLDRAQTRERLRQCGVRAHKVRVGGPCGAVVLSLTIEEAERVRHAGPGGAAADGWFYVIQLVPDLDPVRIRLGFTESLTDRLRYLRAGAPTATVRKSWPCRPAWVAVVQDCLLQDCRPFLNDSLQCDDLGRLVERGDQLFHLLPPVPAAEGPAGAPEDDGSADGAVPVH